MDFKKVLETVEEYLSAGMIPEEEFLKLFSSYNYAELKEIRLFLESNDIRIVHGDIDDISIFDLDDNDIYTDDVTSESKNDNEYYGDRETETSPSFDTTADSEQYSSTKIYKDSNSFYQRLKSLSSSNYLSDNPKLISDYIHGDPSAFEKIIINNNRLVWKQAYAFHKLAPHMDVDDLFQAGVLGMMRAIQKFNPAMGTQFSTYAVHWIKQSIMREIDDTANTIRIPVHMMEQIRAVSKLDSKYDIDGYDYQERVTHISSDLNLPKERIEYILFLKNAYIKTTSLDTPVGEDKESLLADFIPDPKNNEANEIEMQLTYSEYISNVLSILKEREKDIIIKRFGLNGCEPMTLEEIGMQYGLTRERIRQIEAKALRRIKSSSLSRKLIKELEISLPSSEPKKDGTVKRKKRKSK